MSESKAVIIPKNPIVRPEKIYYEYCEKFTQRNGTFIEKSQLKDKVGFKSHYGFPEEAVAWGKDNGSTNLNQFLLYADMLLIDLDEGYGIEGENAKADIQDALEELGLSYQIYVTGNKGFHFIIPHQPVKSFDLPYSHAQFIKGLNIKADMSIYQAARLIRLPNTIHEKTGKKKELIYSHEGKKLQLEIVKKPLEETFISPSSSRDSLVAGLRRAIKAIENEPSLGSRHTLLWGFAHDLFLGGADDIFVSKLINMVNDGWKNKKTKEEIKAIVLQAKKRVK